MGKCNNYTPDIQAQGDCIQCGCAFEDHEAKKEYKLLKEWVPFKVGERFVNECGSVTLVVDREGLVGGALPSFWASKYTPLDRDTVDPEPEATAAPDYNNGDWWGWNGGECPVHPESVVEAVWVGDSSPNHFFKEAEKVSWDDPNGQSIIAFRVTKQYVEPSKPIETKSTVFRKNDTGVFFDEDGIFDDNFTEGTMTTTTQDGKCIRVVWEPCDG